MTQTASDARVAGKAYRTFVYQGTTYLLSQPIRVGTYADEMAVVLYLRQDPGEFAWRMVQRLPASYHAGIWEGAAAANMRGIPSEEEWGAYNKSSWKTAFMLWTCLDPKHKKVAGTEEALDTIDGVEWCLRIISSLPNDELQALLIKIAYVSQDAAIKNSCSPPEAEAQEGQKQPMETQPIADPSPCTDSLPDPITEE